MTYLFLRRCNERLRIRPHITLDTRRPFLSRLLCNRFRRQCFLRRLLLRRCRNHFLLDVFRIIRDETFGLLAISTSLGEDMGVLFTKLVVLLL